LAGCGKPSLDVPASLNTIGQATPVTVHVHDEHGVSKLTATLEKNGARYEAWQSTVASKNADSTFSFSIGTIGHLVLHEGFRGLVPDFVTQNAFRVTHIVNQRRSHEGRFVHNVREDVLQFCQEFLSGRLRDGNRTTSVIFDGHNNLLRVEPLAHALIDA
jgi:hypothetical protein